MELPVVTLTEEGYKITDQWGASLIINHYRHKDTNERRVQILFDNENQGVREWLEENDESVDIPQALFGLLSELPIRREQNVWHKEKKRRSLRPQLEID